jgi:hypothetical protein
MDAAWAQAILSAIAILVGFIAVWVQHGLKQRDDEKRERAALAKKRENLAALVSALATTAGTMRSDLQEMPLYPLEGICDNAARSLGQLYSLTLQFDISAIADFQTLLRWALVRRDVDRVIYECRRIVDMAENGVDVSEMRPRFLVHFLDLETALREMGERAAISRSE